MPAAGDDELSTVSPSPLPAPHQEMESEEVGDAGIEKRKSSRHRSRKLKHYEDIRKQMEFYFSDANLTKQRVMKEIVQSADYVPLSIFVERFNKITQLCKNVDDIRRALKNSEKLELSEDSSGVRRKVPFDETKVKDDKTVENCTIYVENIPSHVNHDWIEKIFQEFGQVAYVSLPKYKRSKQPKGFAFVEFEDEDAAKRCLEAYGEMGGCLPTNIDPSALMSITSFNNEKEPVVSPKKKGRNLRKRTRADASIAKQKDEDEIVEKKIKTEAIKEEKGEIKLEKEEQSDEAETGSKHLQVAKQTDLKELKPIDPNDIKLEEKSDSENVLTSETEVVGQPGEKKSEKKKKRRKNRKKNYVPESEEKLESDLIHLKILPKQNWRQLRNRYLNLQRENYAKLKAQMRNSGNQRFFEPQQTSSGLYKSVCVRISLLSPAESREALASQITSDVAPSDWSNFVKYVDYEEATLDAVVRLDGGPRAGPGINAFIKKAKIIFTEAILMTEKETDEYWASTKAKLKEKKKDKVRGKDRLLNQATKFATSHIHFEDTEEKVGEGKSK